MKAPQNPTVIPINPVQNKNVILFAPELSDFIRKKGKVKTYRFDSEKYKHLKVGDQIELREYGTNILISRATIVDIKRVKFKDLPLKMEGHEVYESKEHQRRVFSSYYRYLNRSIEDSDYFLVISLN